MSASAFHARRDLAKKKSRLAYLIHFVGQNVPAVLPYVETGYYKTAADMLDTHAKHCAEISKLQEEVMQLSLEIERIDSEQTEMAVDAC